MSYSAIPDANITNGSPLRDVDLFALRDNAIAIAELDATAPKPLAVASSSVTVFTSYMSSDAVTTETAYRNYQVDSASSSIPVRVYAAGVIRVSADHRTDDVTKISYLRILKNGALDTEWTTASLTLVARSSDIVVAFGDIITIQQKATSGASSLYQNVKIRSDRIIVTSPLKGL